MKRALTSTMVMAFAVGLSTCGVVADRSDCFISGTPIVMSDGTPKLIEEIQLNDSIKSWNPLTGKIEEAKVSEIRMPLHKDMVVLAFDHATNKNTFDHPYYIEGKGWCSYNPKMTLERCGLIASQLETGDVGYFFEDGTLVPSQLLNITEEIGAVQTFNLVLDENHHSYFAGGMLVHNER